MFNAGAIMAEVVVDTSQAKRDLDAIKREADAAGKDRHIRIDAVFDNASVGRARMLFAQLDNQLSRDAANRLRSSPQGSVLGALNSLFSPHPVSGAPTASQSAQSGLLGRMAGGQASSAATPGGLTTTGPVPRDAPQQQAQMAADERQQTQLLKQIADDTRSGGGRGGLLSMLRGRGGGGGGGGGLALGGLLGHILGGGGGTAATGIASGLAGGAGPGILGMSTKLAGGIGLGGLLLGALPAATGIGAGAGVIGLGAAALLTGKHNPLAAQVKDDLKQAQDIVKSAAQPLVAPLMSAFRSLGPFLKSLAPELHSLFAGAAPLVRPLLDSLEQLVKGMLPGLIRLLDASRPAFVALDQIAGTLGRDLGGMFRAFASAMGPSSVLLKAIMDTVGSLLPVIGRLAALFATALAPVVSAFGQAIRALEPALTIVGRVIASLAGAVLGDLAGAFKAVAILLRDLAPSLNILGSALSKTFGVLENSGIFATLADALEKLAGPLAQLVNTLVKALAPDLPIIITALSKMSQVMVTLAAAGLSVILKGVTELVKWLGPLIKWIGLAVAADYALGAALAFVAANPVVAIIGGIVLLTGAIVELVKHWSTVWATIKRLAEDAWNFIWNGFGKFLLPLLGPAGLIALGAVELAQHWKQVWGDIKNWTLDAWNWLQDNVWHPLEHLLTSTLPGWWDTAVSAVKSAWTKVEDAVKTPVNWVIRYVLDDGLIKAFNWISSKVGGPHIPDIPTLARGGTIPGYGGGDSVLAALEPGETVVPKHHSRQLAWLWKALGIPGYQAGGTAPRPGGPQALHTGIPQSHISGDPTGILGTFKKIYDAGRIIAAIASGNNTALDNAFYALMGHGVGGAVGDMASLLLDIPKTLVHDAVHWLISQFAGSSGKGGPVGSGAGRIASGGLIRTEQLYAQSQFPRFNWPLSQMGDLISLWNRESGWNPWAVNASSGAAGIAQSLGHGPVQLGDWMAQINWGLNYIRSTYVNPANAWAHEISAGWYDNGGWLPPGGSMAFNQTTRREAVLTPAESQAFIDLGDAALHFSRGMGNTGTGAVMRDVYIQLPEGTAVAQMLNELTFRLKVAQMNGYAGPVPGG